MNHINDTEMNMMDDCLRTDNRRFVSISEKSYEKEKDGHEKNETDCIYTYAGIEFDDLCSMWKEKYGYE